MNGSKVRKDFGKKRMKGHLKMRESKDDAVEEKEKKKKRRNRRRRGGGGSAHNKEAFWDMR